MVALTAMLHGDAAVRRQLATMMSERCGELNRASVRALCRSAALEQRIAALEGYTDATSGALWMQARMMCSEFGLDFDEFRRAGMTWAEGEWVGSGG